MGYYGFATVDEAPNISRLIGDFGLEELMKCMTPDMNKITKVL